MFINDVRGVIGVIRSLLCYFSIHQLVWNANFILTVIGMNVHIKDVYTFQCNRDTWVCAPLTALNHKSIASDSIICGMCMTINNNAKTPVTTIKPKLPNYTYDYYYNYEYGYIFPTACISMR